MRLNDPVVILPLEKPRFPVTVSLMPNTIPEALLTVRLLNEVVALPPKVCAIEPLKFMVLPVEVKVPPLLVQSPETLCVKPPAVSVVPEPKVKAPPMLNPITAVAVTDPEKIKLPDMVVVLVCNVLASVPEKPRLA